jgi:hypothetical protein
MPWYFERSGVAVVSKPVVLMFGGTGASTLGDLWSWNGTRWIRLSTSGPPRATMRYWRSMAAGSGSCCSVVAPSWSGRFH